MKNRMVDVRDHLVATLEALCCDEKPMDIARAKAVAEVAQTYINAAKVEVDAYKVAGLDTVPSYITAEPTQLPVPRLVSGGRQ